MAWAPSVALPGMGKTGEEALVAMAREIGLLKLRAASRGRLESVLAATK